MMRVAHCRPAFRSCGFGPEKRGSQLDVSTHIFVSTAWILMMFRFSGADFGDRADLIVPDAILWIASGTATSTPQPKSASESQSIVQV